MMFYFVCNCSGGAPNYFPNSFNGPADDRKYTLSTTLVVGNNYCVFYCMLLVTRCLRKYALSVIRIRGSIYCVLYCTLIIIRCLRKYALSVIRIRGNIHYVLYCTLIIIRCLRKYALSVIRIRGNIHYVLYCTLIIIRCLRKYTFFQYQNICCAMYGTPVVTGNTPSHNIRERHLYILHIV